MTSEIDTRVPPQWQGNIRAIREFLEDEAPITLPSNKQSYWAAPEEGVCFWMETHCSECGARFQFVRTEVELLDLLYLPRRCHACWTGGSLTALAKERTKQAQEVLGPRRDVYQRHVLEVIETFHPAVDLITLESLVDLCVRRLTPPTEGRDTRRQNIVRAIHSLAKGADAPFAVSDGRVTLFV